MKKGVNKAIIIGNVVRDPETKKTQKGIDISNITVVTSESWKDKVTGQTIEKPEWHKITFYSKLSEICSNYCKKGQKVYVEGRISTSEYTDKDGKKCYSTSIVAEEFKILSYNNQDHKDTEQLKEEEKEEKELSWADVPF